MKKKTLFIVVFVVCTFCFSQNDSIINPLQEVVILADKKLDKHSIGYKVMTLNDSIILKNTESFTNLLRYNAPIYLREYGAGGTSSASFRGTSASNTAVIWNGININSVNNGQTGFNALTVTLFDAIDVRSGGGSIEYGSGAVGGTIHLTDNLKFLQEETFKNQLVFSLGSYDTYQGLYKLKLSKAKVAVNAGISYNQSENDYPWLDTDFKNTNGAYENIGLNISTAFLLNEFSKLKFYTANYMGERFFSGELPNPLPANDKYQDFNHRNLLVYTNEHERLSHEAKLAYLIQEYRYFADKAFDTFNFGNSKRLLLNYNANYSLKNLNATITSYSEYESVYGKTDQILEKNRRQFSQSFVYNQTIANTVFFDAKVRKDFNSDYTVPFTYALGVRYKPLKDWFVRVNGSKNYRVPTYNDLFWPGQGNLDLTPETATQGEFGLGFKNNSFMVDLGLFYIAAKDKIVWTPGGDTNRPGVWVPINLAEARNTGLELALNYKTAINTHTLQCHLNYSYTNAKDLETDKQVIFTPKHLLNLNASHNYKRFSFFYQQLFNGKVYTTQSNSEDFVIPHYFVANTGVNYKLINDKTNQLQIGVKVNNGFNENYVIQPRRPMPNRNFAFNVNCVF